MSYKNKTLKRYLDDLAAKLPAPGGGSAAAMSAALGVSLVSMVVNFTLGKPRYAKYEPELKKILDKSEKIRSQLLGLVDLDVAAYKSKNIRDCLNVPFMVARLCFEAARLCPELIKKGNINLISDVAVAVALLESGFSAAYCNVEVNLKSTGDKNLTQGIRKELMHKKTVVKNIRIETEAKIGKIIRG
ncbi:MAG: cyclodeaminase/cyclohydrolase family protein [Candidatus Omnitrophota bacterium]